MNHQKESRTVPKRNRKAYRALRDPQVLALMKNDPDFAQYFDDQGLNVIVPKETVRDRIWRWMNA
jgi:hypothetical protein